MLQRVCYNCYTRSTTKGESLCGKRDELLQHKAVEPLKYTIEKRKPGRKAWLSLSYPLFRIQARTLVTQLEVQDVAPIGVLAHSTQRVLRLHALSLPD